MKYVVISTSPAWAAFVIVLCVIGAVVFGIGLGIAVISNVFKETVGTDHAR